MLVIDNIITGMGDERPNTMAHSATDPGAEDRFFAVAEALADESRRDIVSDIVAHPEGLPSMKELAFTTGLHRTTIRQHLEELIGAGVVEVVEFPVGEREKGQPNKFYGITDAARELFDRNGVFTEAHWQDLYARVEKPPEIEAAEAAPRPDG